MSLDPCPDDAELLRELRRRAGPSVPLGNTPSKGKASRAAPNLQKRGRNGPTKAASAAEIDRAIKLAKQRAKTEENATTFKLLCKANGLPIPVREFRFHPTRQWEADFAFVDEKVLLEVEGGAWSGGRHTRGSGYLLDMGKYNAATLMGYKLFRCTPQTLCKPETIALIKEAMAALTIEEGK